MSPIGRLDHAVAALPGRLRDGIRDETLAILKAAGSSLDRIVKTTVYLADLDQFDAMNEVYAKHVGRPAPARTTIEASRLPAGALIEIDVIAQA